MTSLLLLLAHQNSNLSLSLLPSGTFKLIGGYRPFKLELSSVKPAGLLKAPDLATPRYGKIKVGNREFLVAFDGESKLYVDSNRDGDLTNDPPAEWGTKTFTRGGKTYTSQEGSAVLDINYDGKSIPCSIGLYETGSYTGYYMDFSLIGEVTVAGKRYKAVYVDESATWEGKEGLLIVDGKGDGKLGPSQMHAVGQPFLLDGKTYEFGTTKAGFGVKSSSKKVVAPVERDPNEGNGLRTGTPALAFSAKTLSGKTIAFPQSFKGKVVMLDFWATWCGPCMREAPNVVKAYQTYHSKGFEVLGVSLDREGDSAEVKEVTAKQGMLWEQVYDGNYFQAAVAKQYKILAIPEAYLVDGDTGKIIAFGDGIRGDKLTAAVEKALAAKKVN